MEKTERDGSVFKLNTSQSVSQAGQVGAKLEYSSEEIPEKSTIKTAEVRKISAKQICSLKQS